MSTALSWPASLIFFSRRDFASLLLRGLSLNAGSKRQGFRGFLTARHFEPGEKSIPDHMDMFFFSEYERFFMFYAFFLMTNPLLLRYKNKQPFPKEGEQN